MRNNFLAESNRKNKCWWNHLNALDKALLLFIATLTILILCVLLIINRAHENPSSNLCVTSGCIADANRLLGSINKNVDPCDDFYQFVCGNFEKTVKIPPCKASVDRFTEIKDTMSFEFKTLLEADNNNNNASEIKPFRLIKDYYKACMNKSNIEKIGLTQIKAIIRNELGGWPVLEDHWNKDGFDWKNMTYKLRKLGLYTNGLIKLTTFIDHNNSTKYALFLYQADLNLDKKFYDKGRDDPFVKAYYNFMVDIAIIFGAGRPKAIQHYDECFEFETKLANISISAEEARHLEALNNLKTIANLQETFPTIPWLQYINNVIGVDSITLNENYTLYVKSPNYFKELEVLLQQTPKRVLSNYLIWNNLAKISDILNDELLERRQEYIKAAWGQKKRSSRWKLCFNKAVELNLAAAALYVRKYLKNDTRKDVNKLVAEIRLEFRNNIVQAKWLDDRTKTAVLEKLDALVEHVGYPDELLDNQKLIDYYRDLEVDPNNFLLSNLNLSLFFYKDAYSDIHRTVNKTSWIFHSNLFEVGAKYDSVENSFVIPPATLRGVFFDKTRPNYMNFGGVGFVIGFILASLFDDQNRLYDKNGHFEDLWSPEAKRIFKEKAQCFIEQYGNYTVSEVNSTLNGVITQGSNMGDNGGVNVAYLAYRNWQSKYGEEKLLPGLPYTTNQLFWMSVATIWCTKASVELIQQTVETNSNSLARFRVIGTFSNNKYFAEDFNCPRGSTMNPVKKCTMW